MGFLVFLAILDGEKQSQYTGLRPEIRQLRWRGRMPVAPCRSGNKLKGLVWKNKANRSRIEYCVMRIAKRNLKKQSQLQNGQIGVKSYVEGDYGITPLCGAQKNKPNSKPIKACPIRQAQGRLWSKSNGPISAPPCLEWPSTKKPDLYEDRVCWDYFTYFKATLINSV